MALLITHDQLDSIRRHAERDYPHECCGLLLGHAADAADTGARRALVAHPMRNATLASPRNRFDFDPAEHLEAQRQARARGLEIVGFYHSHPDHPARPSQFDLDHATWPGYSFVIVSILGDGVAGHAADLNSFDLADDRSRFIPESITPTEAS